MENELCKKKTTAPDTSVGADDGQPLHNSTENSISAFEEEINGDFQNNSESLDEIYRRMQRLTDPHYLHTISMTELYQTAYQSRPPIIDGLLYAGAYILAGAPKIGKSFLVAQIAYEVLSPKCVVIIGKLASMNSTQIAAFESFRNSLSGVQILTFDELYQRVIDLIAILSETPSPTQHTPELEDEGDEFPF